MGREGVSRHYAWLIGPSQMREPCLLRVDVTHQSESESERARKGEREKESER